MKTLYHALDLLQMHFKFTDHFIVGDLLSHSGDFQMEHAGSRTELIHLLNGIPQDTD